VHTPNWNGGPPKKKFKGEHVKSGLKFRVWAPKTLALVGVASRNFHHYAPLHSGVSEGSMSSFKSITRNELWSRNDQSWMTSAETLETVDLWGMSGRLLRRFPIDDDLLRSNICNQVVMLREYSDKILTFLGRQISVWPNFINLGPSTFSELPILGHSTTQLFAIRVHNILPGFSHLFYNHVDFLPTELTLQTQSQTLLSSFPVLILHFPCMLRLVFVEEKTVQ